MIVLDASAAVDWLLRTNVGLQIENRIFARNESLHAPHLLHLEVAQVLRRVAQQNAVSPRRAEEAVSDLADLRIHLYPHGAFLPRIWQLRHNFSAYDAVYVALAEILGGTLVTRDRRLGSTATHAAKVEVF